MMLGNRDIILIVLMTAARSTLTRAWVVSPSNGNHHSTKRNVSCKSPSASVSATTTWSCSRNKKNTVWNSCLSSSVISPRRADVGGGIDDNNIDDIDCERENLEEELHKQEEKFSQLFALLQAEPQDLLRFENENSSGERGIFLNRSIKSGEIVLKLPLDSCLTDDESPSWLHNEVHNDPHRWATRLAASWIDLYLKIKQPDNDDNNTDNAHQVGTCEGHIVWSSLLPDPEYMKASLPVHWPETTVLNARSTVLELAVDSAYFARAEAVTDLVRGIQRSQYIEFFSNEGEVDMYKRMNELAHHALDLVQTRSCRLKVGNQPYDPDCRRALAPIFDFINHGSRNTASANACFALEEEEEQEQLTELLSPYVKREYLVVRTLQDISQDEEVKIDYGASARPAWKCLLSYGFVPEYKRTAIDTEGEENLAEVYMKGVRYEVADDSVPIDMVTDASPRPWIDEDGNDAQSNENVLTPDIALRLADRIADAAYYLLLEPEQILDENESNLEEDSDTIPPTPFEVISKQLAASLRWSQHRILLMCAAGLTQFAKEQIKEEESAYQ